MSHGMAAVGGALYLARHFRMLALYLGELVGVDGIGQGTACVEKHLVFNAGKGAYFYIRYVFAQLIFQSLARGVGIVVATVCERELMLTAVDAGGDALVEQGEADDAILAFPDDLSPHALYFIAADGEGT